MKLNFSNLNSDLIGAIASHTIMTMVAISAIASFELFLPLQVLNASESSIANTNRTQTKQTQTKQTQTKQRVVKIAGTYNIIFTPEFLDEAKKAGLKSLSGQWTIKPNGEFEAIVKSISTSGESQTIKSAGRVSIIDGKVVSQVETINGKKPQATYSTQAYTLQVDEKTLQADGQPVKLVRQ